jgi:hypothetical protein
MRRHQHFKGVQKLCAPKVRWPVRLLPLPLGICSKVMWRVLVLQGALRFFVFN